MPITNDKKKLKWLAQARPILSRRIDKTKVDSRQEQIPPLFCPRSLGHQVVLYFFRQRVQKTDAFFPTSFKNARLQTAAGTIHIAIDTNLYLRLRPMAIGQKENDAMGGAFRTMKNRESEARLETPRGEGDGSFVTGGCRDRKFAADLWEQTGRLPTPTSHSIGRMMSCKGILQNWR